MTPLHNLSERVAMAASNRTMTRPAKEQSQKSAAEKAKSSFGAIALALHPAMRACDVLPYLGGEPSEDWAMVMIAVQQQCEAVKRGETSRALEMLVAQAHTLDALFKHALVTARAQTSPIATKSHLRLALKAQEQCRMAWEAVATIQNPASKPTRNSNGRTKAKQAAHK